jgi:hypothetical protein
LEANQVQIKQACVAFLKDIRSQIGAEKYQEWAIPLGLPTSLRSFKNSHVAVVQQITQAMGIDLMAYVVLEEEVVIASSSTARQPDFHTIWEDHHMIDDPRTVQTIITSIQRDFPEEASKVNWNDYGWSFLVRYSVADQMVERITIKADGEASIKEVPMKAPRSYSDYLVGGKVETPGWKTSIPTTNVKKQKITAWEVIPYDRKTDQVWLQTNTVSIKKQKLLDLVADADEFGRTKVRSKNGHTPYYACDDEGRVKTAKASNNNAESYFGFKNTKQRVKSTIKSGGKSSEPKAGHLPEHLQTMSRHYNLPRLDKMQVAKKFYLYYTDGHILLKEQGKEPLAVARFTYSESREAYIPIPMMPLTQGQNRRIWDCVQSYLGIGSGKKTARQRDLEAKIETPQVLYLPVMPWEVNKNVGSSNLNSKTSQRRKAREEKLKRIKSKVKIK